MHRRTRPLLLVTAGVAALVLAACGGSSKDSGSSSTTAVSSASTTTAASAVPTGGTGKGTVTIADKSFAFDLTTCAIKGQALEANGKGTFEGQPFTAVVRRSVSSTSTLETTQLAITTTKTEVATNFVADAAAAKLKISGQKVDGTMTFTGGEGLPSGDGTVSVTCSG